MTRPAQSTGSTLRPALTLVEALVLLLLVFIGVAVLLSYLQQVRTAARRAQCMNNLKLIGEAIYYYEGTHDYLQAAKLLGRARGAGHGTLPAARIDDGYATWAVLIAPYVGSDNPLKAWELGKPYAAQSDEARHRWLAEHLCPARARESMLSSSGDAGAGGAHLPGAVGDYACAAGDGDPRHPWTGPDANGAIILGEVLAKKGDVISEWRSRTSLASLRRWLSNTVLVGEKHVPTGAFGQAALGDGSLYNGQHAANCSRVGGLGYGLAPQPAAPFNNNFGSWHPGLCQFLIADLSVRPFSNNISEKVLGDLIRRDEAAEARPLALAAGW